MALIEPGKKAPAFSLNDQDHKPHKLADYAGHPVILYFYPKDDTPGCTKESCDFRDNLRRYISQGELIGRQGKDAVSIPVPQIDIPQFRFGEKQAGGVGQGDGENGDPVGLRPASEADEHVVYASAATYPGFGLEGQILAARVAAGHALALSGRKTVSAT